MIQLALEERSHWRWWVTPKPLTGKPIHRWYVFPHSFTSELVHALIEEWNLTPTDRILDPFAGAGTTLLAAGEKGIPATGYDLSPFAVLAARVKIANYEGARLGQLWTRLRGRIDRTRLDGAAKKYPSLVMKALPANLLQVFDSIDRAIVDLEATTIERDFFRLALLATIPRHSRAVANGGWLSWVDRQSSAADLVRDFAEQLEMMLKDVDAALPEGRLCCRVREADARALPDADATYSAVITSPPYPNRHDYTRVFGVELMFGFLDWEQTRQLRYQSFHSHPEARPARPEATGYDRPRGLTLALDHIRRTEKDRRVGRMLDGYFLDLYLALREVRRTCKPNARVAFVVGNAQYRGVPIVVDELTAEVGEQAGLKCERVVVARYRGNSAQQMGKYGRRPSRESVVLFQRP